MTLTKAILTIFLFVVLGTALGGGIGFLVGALTPEYYELVFGYLLDNMREEGHPVSLPRLGAGLGLVQGAIWGAVIGPLVVLLVTWYQVRRLKKDGGS